MASDKNNINIVNGGSILLLKIIYIKYIKKKKLR